MLAKAEEEFSKFNLTIIKKKGEFESDNSGEDYKLSSAEQYEFDIKARATLNAYEIVCQRYLDGKLDKKRFSKTYASRLSKLCSQELYHPIIYDGSHDFSALKKVNDMLNDPEK